MRINSLNYNVMPAKSFGKFVKVSSFVTGRDINRVATIESLYLNTDNIENVKITKKDGKNPLDEIIIKTINGEEYKLDKSMIDFKSVDEFIKLLND